MLADPGTAKGDRIAHALKLLSPTAEDVVRALVSAHLPAELSRTADPANSMLREAERLGVAVEHVIEVLWRDLAQDPRRMDAPIDQLLKKQPEEAIKMVWSLVPTEVLRAEGIITPYRHGIPYSVFSRVQWDAFLDV